MSQKIKNYIMAALTLLTMGAPMLVPAAVYADNPIAKGLCTGTVNAGGGSEGDCTKSSPNDSLKKIAAQIVNLLSIVVGIVAVIMVIFGGFKYITSGGESGNITSAKNTLVYAIVGLIIVALAQFIVHYVLSTASSTGLAN